MRVAGAERVCQVANLLYAEWRIFRVERRPYFREVRENVWASLRERVYLRGFPSGSIPGSHPQNLGAHRLQGGLYLLHQLLKDAAPGEVRGQLIEQRVLEATREQQNRYGCRLWDAPHDL